MTLHHILRYITFALTLFATQCDARIDSDSILAFLYSGFLHLIGKKNFHVCKLTQCKVQPRIVTFLKKAKESFTCTIAVYVAHQILTICLLSVLL